MKIIFGFTVKDERKVYNKESKKWDNYVNDLSLREAHRVDGKEEINLIESKKHPIVKIKLYDTLNNND